MKLAQLTPPVNERQGHLWRIDSVQSSGEKLSKPASKNKSRDRSKKLGSVLNVLAVAAIFFATSSLARGNAATQDATSGTRLHLEVSGGDPAGPVEGASVYVRYLVKHRMAKDETVEMNLKTSHDGTVMVPFVPRGDVTVQIVAEHWKPYGQKYQMTEEEQTIKIHLEKPPKWY
jgi:hypothetical protein